MTAWKASSAYRQLDDTFTRVAQGDDEAATAAERLLADGAWVAALLQPLIHALAEDPWKQPPLRLARDRGRLGLQLYAGAAGALTASVLDRAVARTAPPATTLVCSGRIVVVRYHRAAGWRLERWLLDGATDTLLPATLLPLADGMVVRQDGRRGATQLVPHGIGGDVVTVTFATAAGGNAREHDRATGALLRLGASSEADSRTRMLLTLLRLSGRHDAAACFDAATRGAAFDVRWAAMREWLALDAAAAAPRLAAMAADDPHEQVRAAAVATLPLVEARLCRA